MPRLCMYGLITELGRGPSLSRFLAFQASGVFHADTRKGHLPILHLPILHLPKLLQALLNSPPEKPVDVFPPFYYVPQDRLVVRNSLPWFLAILATHWIPLSMGFASPGLNILSPYDIQMGWRNCLRACWHFLKRTTSGKGTDEQCYGSIAILITLYVILVSMRNAWLNIIE